MEQDYTAQQNQLLQELLQNSANATLTGKNLLKQLVQDDPQCGLLQALYATTVNRAALKHAGVYFESAALYKLAHAVHTLPTVTDEQLIATAPQQAATAFAPATEAAPQTAGDMQAGTEAAAPEEVPAALPDTENTEAAEDENAGQLPEEADHRTALLSATAPAEEAISDETEEQEVQIPASEPGSPVIETIIPPDEQEEPVAEPAAALPLNGEYIPGETIEEGAAEPAAVTPPVITHVPPVAEDEDEIYDEIVGIEDINFTPINSLVAVTGATPLAGDDEFPSPEQEQVEPEIGERPDAIHGEGTLAAVPALEISQAAMPPGEQGNHEGGEVIAVEPATAEDKALAAHHTIHTLPETEEAAAADDNGGNETFLFDSATDETEATAHLQAPADIHTQAELTYPGTESNGEQQDADEYYAAIADQAEEEPVVDHQAQPVSDAAPKVADITEKLIIENIAATDYFIFDKAFRDRNPTEAAAAAKAQAAISIPQITASPGPVAGESASDVSKYHDEKMPYSFMWWLDKTRREHAGIYQPYAKPQPTQGDEHQAQQSAYAQPGPAADVIPYIPSENINAADAVQADTSEVRQKEHKIIERFVLEEPQIKPPSGDKLGSENKAKRSAEDQDELITETLARIYTDQMLYAKAIATYRKLMLKLPEKSTYFAGQITLLQQKIS